MGRYQRGHIFEQHGAFHVRYYTTEIADGQPKRVQRSERLCSKDNKHHSTKCKPVQQLAAGVMERVNARSGNAPDADLKIADFWEQTYLPHIERNTKASTLHGYRKLWAGFLAVEFANFKLQDYQTHHATRFLTALAERGLGIRTIAHIRSLASGMFRHALRLNRISTNPWRDAGSLSAVKKPEATHAYTLEQAEAISNALIDHPPAQLVFCLAAFMGLRPGEISALQWEDIDTDWMHIRRSAWRGIVGTTKTDESVASVPLIEPIKSMLEAWKIQSGGGEWLFPSNRGDKPCNISQYAQRVIAPVLKAKNLKWHGLYAGRRGAATLLVQLTGNALAAQYALRHKNLMTTTGFYVKPVRSAALEGLKLVEDLLKQRKEQRALAVGSGEGGRS
jgi:integrase